MTSVMRAVTDYGGTSSGEVCVTTNKTFGRINVSNKLGCASVKLLVRLEFTKATSYFIGICYRCSQEATFKVSLKLGQ